MYEETSLESYTTPLDDENSGVDEYELFKNVMEGIEKSNQGWYAQLVSALTVEDTKSIQEIMTLCAQRKAAKESKSIELAGGKCLMSMAVMMMKMTFFSLFQAIRSSSRRYQTSSPSPPPAR
jgi:hypothetical protein